MGEERRGDGGGADKAMNVIPQAFEFQLEDRSKGMARTKNSKISFRFRFLFSIFCSFT